MAGLLAVMAILLSPLDGRLFQVSSLKMLKPKPTRSDLLYEVTLFTASSSSRVM
ncbi:hypothetical protein D3C87_2068740 [compost metagenome]